MRQLCQSIGMPGEVTERIVQLDKMLGTVPGLEALRREETWEAGRKGLKKILGEDPDGMKELCCQLRCALEARKTFEEIGLSEEIYTATMGCFSRFVREHKESYGRYGFDRGFWTVRQISAKLFRIGQLEYELMEYEGEKAVSLHIPTDARFTPDVVQESLNWAEELLQSRYPDYARGVWCCHSWLLSPTLKEMLPGGSNILAFQKRFAIRQLNVPCEGMQQWVFKNPKLTTRELPEETSLQRKIKAYLLGGGIFWDARGQLLRK